MSKPVLGLIGAIGAGKSTAARSLAALGGAVVDCDELGHRALRGAGVVRQLTGRWGTAILNRENAVDRRAVAGIVFADPGERAYLESVVFPEIRALAVARMAAAEGDRATAFHVLDAAVLLEAGWHDACNKILYVDAANNLRLARLLARSGWTAAEVRAREAAQWPAERKRARADAVVTNDGTPAELSTTLARLLAGWGWLPEPSQGA